MAVTTISGQEIREALVENGEWVWLSQTTSGGSASNDLIDVTYLKGANVPAGRFNGARVRITSGNRDGELAYVDYLDPETGTLYLTPDLSGSLGSGDTYEIWLRGINPDIVDRLRDDCLQKYCSQWRLVPLCIITDGDMESSGVDSWTVVGSATRSKAYASFPDTYTRRELQVTHPTASSDYVKSDPVDVLPAERFFLQAPVKAYVTANPENPATASIQVWDLSNGAEITLGGQRTEHTGVGPGKISLLFTIPADCYRIEFRLKSDTNSSTTIWGGINCHKREKSEMTLPQRITSKKRVGNFYITEEVDPSTQHVADSQLKLPPWFSVERVQIGQNVRVFFQPWLSNVPYWYYERGFFARLQSSYFTASGRSTGDAATTDIQKEYIVAALTFRVCEYMLDKYGAEWQDDFVRAAAEFNHWEREMGPEPRIIHEVESQPQIPNIRV